MGEFYQEKKEEPKEKKIEYIEDADTLVATFDLENEKYQHSKDREYESILPGRHHLLGGPDPKNIGSLNELRNHLRLSKIKEMTIGHRVADILKEIEEVTNHDELYMELVEGHAEHYQFLCESGLKIIDNLYGEIDKLEIKISELKQKVGEKEQVKETPVIPTKEKKEEKVSEK